MKKKYLLTGLLAFAGVASLTSCDTNSENIAELINQQSVTNIEINGQTTTFQVGDTFAAGNITATVTFGNGTTESITLETAGVTITAPETFTAVGSYAVILSYKGYSTSYQVTVTGENNEQTLKSITLDTSKVQTRFSAGDEFSYEGLALYETLANSTTTSDSVVRVTDLSNYTVEILNEADEPITKFSQSGNYTVNVYHKTIDNIEATYNVSVGLYEVNEAYLSGIENAGKVNKTTSNINSNETIDVTFGENYTRVESSTNPGRYTHYEMVNENISSTITDAAGKVLPNTDIITNDYINGAGYQLYDYKYMFGTENVVKYLYELALQNKNNDLEEILYQVNSDGQSYFMYGFSFGYLLPETSMTGYYYETSVRFSLNEDGSFKTVEIELTSYSRSSVVIDDKTGVATLVAGAKELLTSNYEINQTSGARDLKNEYSLAQYQYSEISIENTTASVAVENDSTFDLVYNKLTKFKVINEGTNEVNFPMDTPVIYINDTLATTWNTEWTASISTLATGHTFNITFKTYGTFNVVVKTGKCEYKFTINVAQPTPSALYGRYLIENAANPTLTAFTKITAGSAVLAYEGKDLYLGTTAYPACAVADFTPEVTSGEGATVQMVKYTVGDTEYDVCKFNATQAGTYIVTLTSTAKSTVTSKITINVVEEPSVTEVLSGTYSADDGFTSLKAQFTPSEAGSLSGTVTVALDSPTITETAAYSYDPETGALNVTYTPSEGHPNYKLAIEMYSDYSMQVTYSFGMYNGALTLNRYYAPTSIPAEYAGTYIGTVVGTKVVLTENSVKIVSTDGAKTYKTIGYTETSVSYLVDGQSITIGYGGNTVEVDGNTYTKREPISLDNEYIGRYKITNTWGDSIEFTEYALIYGDYTYDLISVVDGVHTFEAQEDSTWFYVGTFAVDDKGGVIVTLGEGEYAKTYSKIIVTYTSTSNMGSVKPEWYGSFYDFDNNVITISQNVLSINGVVQGSITSVDTDNNIIYVANMADTIVFNDKDSLVYGGSTYGREVRFDNSYVGNTYTSESNTLLTIGLSYFTEDGIDYYLKSANGNVYIGISADGVTKTLTFKADGTVTVTLENVYEEATKTANMEAVPTELRGTFTNSITKDVLVITDDSIKFNDVLIASVVSYDSENMMILFGAGNYIKITDNTYSELTYTGSDIGSFTKENSGDSSEESGESVKAPESLQGTYKNAEGITVIITATTVRVIEGSEDFTLTITKITSSTLTAADNTAPMEFDLNSDGTIGYNGNTLTKEDSGDSSEESGESVKAPESLQGTYKNAEGITVIITATTVRVIEGSDEYTLTITEITSSTLTAADNDGPMEFNLNSDGTIGYNDYTLTKENSGDSGDSSEEETSTTTSNMSVVPTELRGTFTNSITKDVLVITDDSIKFNDVLIASVVSYDSENMMILFGPGNYIKITDNTYNELTYTGSDIGAFTKDTE